MLPQSKHERPRHSLSKVHPRRTDTICSLMRRTGLKWAAARRGGAGRPALGGLWVPAADRRQRWGLAASQRRRKRERRRRAWRGTAQRRLKTDGGRCPHSEGLRSQWAKRRGTLFRRWSLTNVEQPPMSRLPMDGSQRVRLHYWSRCLGRGEKRNQARGGIDARKARRLNSTEPTPEVRALPSTIVDVTKDTSDAPRLDDPRRGFQPSRALLIEGSLPSNNSRR